MEEETERKKRGDEEEKRDTGSRNFRDCYLHHHKLQRKGHRRDPSHKLQTFRILCCKNLEEREEGEGERKVASDNELNFRQEAERLVHLYQGSSQCLCSCRKNLSNDQQGLTPCVLRDSVPT
ncbi:hypothetical protein ACB092_02G032400 [Castanea dentata]